MRTQQLILLLSLSLSVMVFGGESGDARTESKRLDPENSLERLKRAADQGDATAQYELGVIFDNGKGVPQNLEEAVYWYEKAASSGYVAAQRSMAFMCKQGRGTPRDYGQAIYWLKRASSQGDAASQRELATIFSYGPGVGGDYLKACMWLVIASQGRADACRHLEWRMAPQTIAEAQRLAREWRPGLADVEVVARNLNKPPYWERWEWRPDSEGAQVVGPETGSPPASHSVTAPSPPKGDLARALPPPSRLPFERRLVGSGTGFYVSVHGHVMTNAHVVADCASLEVAHLGQLATEAHVTASDPRNDLAVIQTNERQTDAANFRVHSVRQGEAVVVYGFPLSGTIASTGNTTVGHVAALAGLRDDTRMLQISAPIQPGNSGGPVMDMTGAVVGLVVGKLDAAKVMEAIGDIPQNVNFAIKANVAASFLDSYAIEHHSTKMTKVLDVPDVTDMARAISVRVLCYR